MNKPGWRQVCKNKGLHHFDFREKKSRARAPMVKKEHPHGGVAAARKAPRQLKTHPQPHDGKQQ
ncbi:hypothetical protein ACVGWV_00140, partial [Enterobacter asburiae]